MNQNELNQLIASQKVTVDKPEAESIPQGNGRLEEFEPLLQFIPFLFDLREDS